MHALEQMLAAFGAPTMLQGVGGPPGAAAVVARWRYQNAEVRAEPTDAFRFVVSLAEGRRSLVAARGGASGIVSAGSMAMLPPDARVNLAMPTPGDALHILLPIRGPGSLDGVPMRPHFGLHDRSMRVPALRILVGSARAGPDDAVMVEEAVERLYAACRGQAHRIVEGGRRARLSPGARRRVAELVEAHLAGGCADRAPLSLAMLAGAASMSVNHFIRSFCAEMGETPHQHLIRRRVEKAMERLTRGDRSVGEVCDLGGFASVAHFVALFRRHAGVTPGAFRDALRRPSNSGAPAV